jgi:hypothetical protein
MKRALLFLLPLALITTPAVGAPKTISVGLGSIFTAPIGSEAMVLSGKNSIFFRNLNNKNSDIEVIALDQGQNRCGAR